MHVCLKNAAKQAGPLHFKCHLTTRLPQQLAAPCDLNGDYVVKASPDYYELSLHIKGQLTLQCLSCCEDFQYDYDNETQLAVCETEDMAERYSDSHDCIVATAGTIELGEIITDDLHLFLPEKHPEGCSL